MFLQVMSFLNTFNAAELPRIVGLTSCLINQSISPENVYEFLKELEVTFKGAVVSSQYCSVVKRCFLREDIGVAIILRLSSSFNLQVNELSESEVREISRD